MLELKEIRKKKGLYQREVADMLGITQQALANLENGRRKLNQDQIIKLSLSLEVTPNDLLGFDEAYEKYTKYLVSLKEED